MPDWRVEQLRLTAFMPTDLRVPAPDWWRQVAGTEPPNQNIQQGIGIQHSGPVRDGYAQLVLEIKAGRVDWTLGTIPSDAMLTGFPSFDELAPSLQVFRELLLPWTVSIADVRRIAFGAVQTVAVEDRIAGYRELQGLLPSLTLDVERSSDLIYQINRHITSSTVPDLLINRLSTWGVVQAKVQQFQVGPTATLVVGADQAGFSAVRLQIDINSDADRSIDLPSGTMRALCEELVRYGERIAATGDRP